MVQSAPTRSLDLDALRAAAQAFARDEMRPVALSYDETEEYPLPVLRRAAALGLTSYDLPAEYRGPPGRRLRSQWAQEVHRQRPHRRRLHRLRDRRARQPHAGDHGVRRRER